MRRKGNTTHKKEKVQINWEPEEDEESETPKMFITIGETARFTGLSEAFLRKLQKKGKLPGIQCGRRFMVNYTRFLEKVSSDETEY